MTKFIGFVPCRAGSVRVASKNTKPFCGNEEGLIGRKLRQMSAVPQFDEIIVSTDDELVKNIAHRISEDLGDKRIRTLDRPAKLAASGTLDDFVEHVANLRDEGVLYWTHVTSPFFGTSQMVDAITAYLNNVVDGQYDSLMGVTPVQNFIWRDGECISHDRAEVKWPQTQDIEPFMEVNSAVFMYDLALMRRDLDRIGAKPFLFQLNKKDGFDIDWPEDFQLAEHIQWAETLEERGRAF